MSEDQRPRSRKRHPNAQREEREELLKDVLRRRAKGRRKAGQEEELAEERDGLPIPLSF